MAFNTAGIIHYGAITCYFVHNYIANCSAQEIISGSVKRLVINYTSKLVEDYQLQTASLVCEIVLIREGTLELSNRVSLSCLKLHQLVHIISTS